MTQPTRPQSAARRKPLAPATLLQLEQMRHQAEDNLHRAEERAVRYRLQLDALNAALDRLVTK